MCQHAPEYFPHLGVSILRNSLLLFKQQRGQHLPEYHTAFSNQTKNLSGFLPVVWVSLFRIIQRTIQRKFNLEELPGKLQNWYLLNYKELITELAKKKVKLSLSEENEWEAFFIQEAKQALAIKSEIEKTDHEIDRMVYELYGLTEEEIRIVEGTN
ncbi:MAG: hypothetical protein WCI92_12480 [Bacteroidota bacterium]